MNDHVYHCAQCGYSEALVDGSDCQYCSPSTPQPEYRVEFLGYCSYCGGRIQQTFKLGDDGQYHAHGWAECGYCGAI
jgi:hypothetical protein